LTEIRADRKHPSVDTGLDLAFEERRVAKLLAPGAALAHLADGPSHPIARRVHTEISQPLQRVRRGDPGARSATRAATLPLRPSPRRELVALQSRVVCARLWRCVSSEPRVLSSSRSARDTS